MTVKILHPLSNCLNSSLDIVFNNDISEIKNIPQYMEIIDDIKEAVSRSFSAITENGFFLKFKNKKHINSKNTSKAYVITPND